MWLQIKSTTKSDDENNGDLIINSQYVNGFDLEKHPNKDIFRIKIQLEGKYVCESHDSLEKAKSRLLGLMNQTGGIPAINEQIVADFNIDAGASDSEERYNEIKKKIMAAILR